MGLGKSGKVDQTLDPLPVVINTYSINISNNVDTFPNDSPDDEVMGENYQSSTPSSHLDTAGVSADDLSTSLPTSSSTPSQTDDYHVVYGIEVGSRVVDAVRGFVSTVTEIFGDEIVYLCEEMGVMTQWVHAVVALG